MRTHEPVIASRHDHGPHFVQSVARALAVMRSFSADQPRQSLADVARRTGLDRATARRLLLTLVDLGYVSTDARGFELTPRVLELGYAYLSGLSLPEIARPHLRNLATELNETAALAVLDGDDIVYVALVPSARLAAVKINIGTRFQAYATSMGRVLLGALPPQELEEYLARVHLHTRTERAVRTTDWLRARGFARAAASSARTGDAARAARGQAMRIQDFPGTEHAQHDVIGAADGARAPR